LEEHRGQCIMARCEVAERQGGLITTPNLLVSELYDRAMEYLADENDTGLIYNREGGKYILELAASLGCDRASLFLQNNKV